MGAALTVTNLNSTVEELLREKSPAELEQINRSTFRAMGASASDTERILHGGAFLRRTGTTFAVNLKSLNGVANRGAFVQTAGAKKHHRAGCSLLRLNRRVDGSDPPKNANRSDRHASAIFRSASPKTEQLWSRFSGITLHGPQAQRSFTNDVQKLAAQSGQTKKIVVALSGQVSPRLREELEKRGMTVQDRLVPGPLK